jgi:hypothetical protein
MGSLKQKVLPGPSLATAHTGPPCASMIERLMVKAMPDALHFWRVERLKHSIQMFVVYANTQILF